jgi:hypothetical protein
MSEKVFWCNVTEVYKVWAKDEDDARDQIERYLDGDHTTSVKFKDSEFEAFEQ